MKRTLLIYSGGMDSTVLLYWLLNNSHEVSTVSFHYGQRHSRELDAAKAITKDLGIANQVIYIPRLKGSSVTGDSAIPHGHYAEESMKSTVVPNRNMIMIAHATSIAISEDHQNIAYGCHSGDHAVYPDCRPEFVLAMRKVMRLCDWSPVELLTPFVMMDKIEIAKIGQRLKVPFDKTWTCYEGGDIPCQKCGSCVERNEAINALKE